MTTMASDDALQLLDLPSDVLLHVFKFLPGFDALSMGATCKFAHSLVNTIPLWITLIEDRFGQGILQGRAYTTVSDLKELYFILSAPRMPARDMNIAWGREERYWQHLDVPGSEFLPCAILQLVCWLDVMAIFRGVLPGKYVAVWRLQLRSRNDASGYDNTSLVVSVDGVELPARRMSRSSIMDLQRLHQGEWFELGVFTFDVERTSTVTMSIINREGSWKSGLVIDYAEIRPIAPRYYPVEKVSPGLGQTLSDYSHTALRWLGRLTGNMG